MPAGWIPAKALEVFQYEYKSPPLTLLEQWVLNPWWEFVITLVPMNIAPNVITLTGLIINTIPIALIVISDPSFKGEAPWYLYLLAGISIFLY